MLGTCKDNKTVVVIDLGLAKRYIDRTTNQHIPLKQGKAMVGTARFASINTHLGVEGARRDDIESLGYMFIYLAKGSLPWQGLGGNDKQEKYDLIRDKKISTPIEALCKGLPAEFLQFMKMVKSMAFEQEPEYNKLKGLFEKIMSSNNLKNDLQFDWFTCNKGLNRFAVEAASPESPE